MSVRSRSLLTVLTRMFRAGRREPVRKAGGATGSVTIYGRARHPDDPQHYLFGEPPQPFRPRKP